MSANPNKAEAPARVGAQLWLCVAQAAQTGASACLMFAAVQDFSHASRWSPFGNLWLYLFIPIPLLAPVVGAICSRCSARPVLLGCAIANIALVAGFTSFYDLRFYDGVWYLGLPLLALVGMICLTVTHAAARPVAKESGLPLVLVVGNLQAIGMAAFFGGTLLAWAGQNHLYLVDTMFGGALQDALWRVSHSLEEIHVHPIALAVGALYCILLAAADHLGFAAESSERQSITRALPSFFRETGLILKQRDMRATLFGQACICAFMAVSAVSLVIRLDNPFTFDALRTCSWTIVGLALGFIFGTRQRHPRRLLGLVPLASTGLCITYYFAHDVWDAPFPFIVFGTCCAILTVSLWTTYLRGLRRCAAANGVALGHALLCVFAALVTLGYFRITQRWQAHADWQFALSTGLLMCAALAGWARYFKEALEWLVEIVIWPLYRIRPYGPGKDSIPNAGPLLIIANHTSWFDPIWIAKVFPRRVRPMMTSRFYDLPVLRWLMVRVVGAIRVQASGFRREAPELEEAIALLDQGECVLMFPEGRMRRSPDQILRQFGQGVWHILSKRPATPVVVCWIEGGWGSYFSYAGGPPTKNKRLDLWRQIKIAIQAPLVLEPELLKDQRAMRRYLMETCLDARRHLGLEPAQKVEALREDVEMATDANESD